MLDVVYQCTICGRTWPEKHINRQAAEDSPLRRRICLPGGHAYHLTGSYENQIVILSIGGQEP